MNIRNKLLIIILLNGCSQVKKNVLSRIPNNNNKYPIYIEYQEYPYQNIDTTVYNRPFSYRINNGENHIGFISLYLDGKIDGLHIDSKGLYSTFYKNGCIRSIAFLDSFYYAQGPSFLYSKKGVLKHLYFMKNDYFDTLIYSRNPKDLKLDTIHWFFSNPTKLKKKW